MWSRDYGLGLGLAILVLAVCKSSGVLVNQEEHASTSNSVAPFALVTSYVDALCRIHDWQTTYTSHVTWSYIRQYKKLSYRLETGRQQRISL